MDLRLNGCAWVGRACGIPAERCPKVPQSPFGSPTSPSGHSAGAGSNVRIPPPQQRKTNGLRAGEPPSLIAMRVPPGSHRKTTPLEPRRVQMNTGHLGKVRKVHSALPASASLSVHPRTSRRKTRVFRFLRHNNRTRQDIPHSGKEVRCSWARIGVAGLRTSITTVRTGYQPNSSPLNVDSNRSTRGILAPGTRG